jgi:RNase P/RNase MRP subunit p29
MTRMPEQGAEVQLRDQHGSAHRSEVIERDQQLPGTLLLAPPADLPPARPFSLGTRLLVSWPDDHSYWVLPVRLVELRPAGEQQLLVAEVDDDAWREERRQYARSALDAEVQIDLEVVDEDDVRGPAGVAAELIDLSEVALRGVVQPAYRDWFVPKVPVTVRLALSGDRFELAGTVLLAKPAARLDHGLEVVILFDRPVPRVDELRRHIAKQQPVR